MYRSALVLLCACALPSLAAANDAAPRDVLRRLPLRFEANAGQWNRAVRYAARGAGYQLFLTPRQAVLAFDGSAVQMSLAHANPAPAIQGLDPLPSRAAYFVGPRSAWRPSVAQYNRVRYASVYPGIDVIYYGAAGELEYDFVLAPQADPSRIRIDFRGARGLTLTPEGDLAIDASGHTMLQKRPVVYQQTPSGRRLVEARYVLLGRHSAGVQVAAYDRTHELTIDPVLSYGSLIGASGNDGIRCVQVNSKGLVYVSGYVSNADITGTDGAFKATSTGSTEGFLAILDPNASGPNSLKYFSYIGGSGSDQINAMALDGTGLVYLAGSTTSTDFPLGGTNVNSSNQGTTDAFVVKFDPSASGADALVYGTYLGGSSVDVAYAVAVDRQGLIYVAGTTRSDAFPVTSSAYASVRYGAQDAFLSKIDPNSTAPLLYSSYFGSEAFDDGRAMVLLANGIVWLGGSTDGSQLPIEGATYRDTFAGGADVFLARFDTTKSGPQSVTYSTYIGGSGLDELRAMTIDPTGQLLLTGYTTSPDFPMQGNSYSQKPADNADVFVLRFDPAAPRAQAITYSTYLGGKGGEVAYGIALDAAGMVWVTGYTLSLDFPVAGGPVLDNNPGGVEVFVARLDMTKSGPAGLVYSTYLGANGVHVGYAITVAPDGAAYVGGQTNAGAITTGSAYQRDFGGGTSDGFLAVLAPQ